MKIKPINTVIYYVPVDPKFFDKGEYYRVDLKMLNDAHDKVITVHNFVDFIKLALTNKINLVYFWWWHSSLPVILLSKLLGIRVIGTGAVHMFDESGAPDFFKRTYLYRLLNRIAWRMADQILFISNSQFRQITSHEKVVNPTILKSSSIFNKNQLAELSKNKTANDSIQLLTVCWLTKDQLLRKSIDKILKAISMLPTESLNKIKLYIVGGHGDGINFLKGIIEELNLSENIFIEIDISNNRKIELYKSSNLYIQPSYYEGFGNSVLEAMTYGTPCLVSSYTAQPEVVLGTGYTIKKISNVDIYEAILDYSNKSIDARQKMIKDVKHVVINNHSYDSRLKDYLLLIK